MSIEILHSGFDGLKFTVQTDIPPDLRALLAEAKAEAIRTNADAVVDIGGMQFAVRRSGGSAFSLHTGDYGAEWYILDPENRPKNNPGVTVDFRAFLLASGGLRAAQDHFEACMAALGIPYVETQLRVSRVDFAIDILAPWFEPDSEALVAPPGTRSNEHTSIADTEVQRVGRRVTGLRAGAVANRQLAIYDKRAEIMAKRKLGWLVIWNAARTNAGKPPLDLTDRNESQVWRFELRLGSKQLRNKWEMRSWFDLNAMIGDAFVDFCQRVRYCIPNGDQNRSRWLTHELWETVTQVVSSDLNDMRSGIVPEEVKTANREAHKRMLDAQTLGLIISSAAASGIELDGIDDYVHRHAVTLKENSREHPAPIEERLNKAKLRTRFR